MSRSAILLDGLCAFALLAFVYLCVSGGLSLDLLYQRAALLPVP